MKNRPYVQDSIFAVNLKMNASHVQYAHEFVMNDTYSPQNTLNSDESDESLVP